MRRADRLFQIIQILRGARRPVTADQLAEELETTSRTIYRDIADLVGQRVPIRGAAGVGYILEAGYDLPPLMLTANEIEAAVLGAQWVAERGDPALARGARDLMGKILAVIPRELHPTLMQAAVVAPNVNSLSQDDVDLERIRRSIRSGEKVLIRYLDLKGQASERRLWPTTIAYFETARLLVAWCELRGGFRNFRTDRIQSIEFLEERIPISPGELRRRWNAARADERAV